MVLENKMCPKVWCEAYGDFSTVGAGVGVKKEPSYTYGDFQTTDAVVGVKKYLSYTYADFQTTVAVQRASKRTFEYIWDTFRSENSGGIWIIGDQKVNTE